jgi:hypothetical protein
MVKKNNKKWQKTIVRNNGEKQQHNTLNTHNNEALNYTLKK